MPLNFTEKLNATANLRVFGRTSTTIRFSWVKDSLKTKNGLYKELPRSRQYIFSANPTLITPIMERIIYEWEKSGSTQWTFANLSSRSLRFAASVNTPILINPPWLAGFYILLLILIDLHKVSPPEVIVI